MGWMAPLRHLSAKLLCDRISSEWEPSMGEVTTIGLDLAKQVFQVHGVDAKGAAVFRQQLRRGPGFATTSLFGWAGGGRGPAPLGGGGGGACAQGAVGGRR